jgi:hypothetical protein
MNRAIQQCICESKASEQALGTPRRAICINGFQPAQAATKLLIVTDT